jgi:hypothetical protein
VSKPIIEVTHGLSTLTVSKRSGRALVTITYGTGRTSSQAAITLSPEVAVKVGQALVSEFATGEPEQEGDAT